MGEEYILKRAPPKFTPVPKGAFERVNIDAHPSVGHDEYRGGPVNAAIREFLHDLRREQSVARLYVPR